MSTIALLAALACQADEGIPRADDERHVRRRISDLEAKLRELDRKTREAVQRDDPDAARRHAAEHQEAGQELEKLRHRLDELEARTPLRLEWYENFNFELRGLLTHWDNDLDLDDGFGWGAAAYFRDFLFLQYRRWQPDDEDGDDDAGVASYVAGFTYEFGLAEPRRSAFVIGAGAGIVRFASDAPGSDGDTGPILSIMPQWKFYLGRRVRLNAGLDADILRSDFNQNHTHTHHNFSAVASIEFAF